jgi:hypothetical protein
VIQVALSCSPVAREVFEQVCGLRPSTTLADAVKASGLSRGFLTWIGATP